jgi:hypothetical protein
VISGWRGDNETGLALIETVLLGTLMLVPIVWALGVLAELHRGALAATAAAREAGYEAAHAPSESAAANAIDNAVRQAFADQGLPGQDARVRWSAGGFRRGDAIEILVAYPVTVLQAPLLGRAGGPVVWVRAAHVARLDPFGSRD